MKTSRICIITLVLSIMVGRPAFASAVHLPNEEMVLSPEEACAIYQQLNIYNSQMWDVLSGEGDSLPLTHPTLQELTQCLADAVILTQYMAGHPQAMSAAEASSSRSLNQEHPLQSALAFLRTEVPSLALMNKTNPANKALIMAIARNFATINSIFLDFCDALVPQHLSSSAMCTESLLALEATKPAYDPGLQAHPEFDTGTPQAGTTRQQAIAIHKQLQATTGWLTHITSPNPSQTTITALEIDRMKEATKHAASLLRYMADESETLREQELERKYQLKQMLRIATTAVQELDLGLTHTTFDEHSMDTEGQGRTTLISAQLSLIQLVFQQYYTKYNEDTSSEDEDPYLSPAGDPQAH